MANDLVSPEKPALASVGDLIRHVALGGAVTPQTLKELLAVQLGMDELQAKREDQEAKKEFIAARARLKFPPITKSKRSLNATYAPFDKIQEIIDPILESEGFTLSFTSGEPNDKQMIPITGKLSHRLGHSETGTLWQPIGAVSRGMNPNQAMGSAISYGQRYCAAMMLNLRFVDLDNNAQTFSTINEREVLTLQKLIDECGMDAKSTSQFLEWAGKQQGSPVKTLSDILQGEPYQGAFNMLLKKRKQTLESKK